MVLQESSQIPPPYALQTLLLKYRVMKFNAKPAMVTAQSRE
jgi:hypothetical protein